MRRCPPDPIVHLELRTTNLARACGFYTRLFGWRPEVVDTGSGVYLALDVGAGIGAGVREQSDGGPFWVPYIGVADAAEACRRAGLLGASVVLGPREGPAGWRSVLAAPDGSEIALWQPKR